MAPRQGRLRRLHPGPVGAAGRPRLLGDGGLRGTHRPGRSIQRSAPGEVSPCGFEPLPPVAVALALVTAACGDGGTSTPGALIASDLQRRSPDAPAGDVAAVAAGANAFAAAAYALLAAEDGNLVYSPASIRLALAMTYAGARGQTAAEMAEVLRFDLADAALHAAFNALDQELASRTRSSRTPGTGW